MPIKKYGSGEVLPPESEDQDLDAAMRHEAALAEPWTEQDERELERENER